VVSEVFVLNIGLAALAIASTLSRSWAADIFLGMLGGLAVMFVMARFSRRR
jgi:hypothetical protein